jgi:hypothetical protein
MDRKVKPEQMIPTAEHIEILIYVH